MPMPTPRLPCSLLAAVLGAGCALSDPQPGALGLGDSYYPGLGNGGYDVRHYDLELRIDPTAGSLEGRAILSAVATSALCSLSLDLWKLDVREVWVDGRSTAFSHEDGELVVGLAPALREGQVFSLAVDYGGLPEGRPCVSVPFLDGVGWLRSDDSVHVVSQPMGASTFYPCNDHPTDKAFYDLHLTVPAGQVAVANGERVGVDLLDDGARTYHYRVAEPMASYLATLAVGPFEVDEQQGPVPLTYVYHPSVPEAARAAFDDTAAMLTHFGELFGPYPFSRFGGIASNLPMGAALETQSIPTYGQHALSASTVAHELAHQWFGNSVSVADFSDLWISEAFASYATWLWSEHQDPASYTERVARTAGFVREAKVGPPVGLAADELFGAPLYGRGPLALHALREAVGDEAFFELLRAWTSTHRHANASVADFEALVAERAGAEAAAILAAWLHDAEAPALTGLAEPDARG